MSLVLRLARFGRKKRPFYRIVATDRQNRRDGSFAEVVGTYNPLTHPSTIVINEDRVKHYIANGAELTDRVKIFIKNKIPGFLEGIEDSRRNKIILQRKKRKERLATRS
jgi:small subunit ribosomal protein S16